MDGKTLSQRLRASPTSEIMLESANHIDALEAEIARLKRIIDSRPAINAGLPQTYIEWSQSIYAMQFAHALETQQ